MTQTQFSTEVDIETETSGLLASCADLLAAGRQVLPRITFYRRSRAKVSVTARSFEEGNILDRNRSILDIMYLVPAILPDLAIISYCDPVQLSDGIRDSLIVIAVNRTGAQAQPYPWNTDDEGHLDYIRDATLSPLASGVYSDEISHMLPVFFTTKDSAFLPSDVLQYLLTTGNEVNLYDDWTIENIDSKCDLFV